MIKKFPIKFLVFVIGFLITFDCRALARECVILLHGLGRTCHSMSSLESILKRNNYFVVNENYPSTKKSIETIANQYVPLMVGQFIL
jgi:hypothetical protein